MWEQVKAELFRKLAHPRAVSQLSAKDKAAERAVGGGEAPSHKVTHKSEYVPGRRQARATTSQRSR